MSETIKNKKEADKTKGTVKIEVNSLNGNYMVWIEEASSQMYAIPNKREAYKFYNSLKNAFSIGELLIENGKVVKKQMILEV